MTKRICKFKTIQECQQLGIEGKHPRKEIIALLDDLPKIYETLTADCNKLTKPMEYYQNFCSDEELLSTLRVKNIFFNFSSRYDIFLFLFYEKLVSNFTWKCHNLRVDSRRASTGCRRA
jgi:hypothetical protein